ncbi:protein phosphatase inhibitor protein [Cardiosporidium cionae]|uniref:Protein phosphatase inhibitor protein n=1 Tax=Cardiosporidium cionae TaxID=476202 RepID=A0ABQ7J9Y6_9APIC|nr:protein phosphatase inhibitor protein [Cardiosporidium cionae]|eukprot:KAF8820739.1 protein phosphatase inhibitor protein [Cardiosporidium cionae]
MAANRRLARSAASSVACSVFEHSNEQSSNLSPATSHSIQNSSSLLREGSPNASAPSGSAAEKSGRSLHILKLKPDKCVRWEEGTVDNENMDKQTSKSCCIFHKSRRFGESSTESSCAENSDSDQECKEDSQQ